MSPRLILLGLAILCGEAVYPDGAVEGRVPVPEAKSSQGLTARYRLPATEIGEPDPLVSIVYLESAAPRGVSTNVVRMAQKDLQFRPRVLPIQKGTRVIFPNQDDDYHNVLSFSRAKEFDLGRYLKTENPPSIQFDEAGVVELDCEIHPHMRGTILVLDTPIFDRTNAEGNFKLPSVPEGSYTLKVYIDFKTTLETPVEVVDGQTTQVDLRTK